jgi:large subunit ribosomal protein L9
MKVILLDEIKGKGTEGDVVDVARGYAVNYLFPRKLATEATSGNLKQLRARSANIEQRELARKADAEGIAAKLDGKRVTIEAHAGEGGRLFGSVTGPMIEDAVLQQLDVDIDRKKMEIHGHIKELGEHPIKVRLHSEVSPEIIVVVVAAGAAGAEPAAAEAVVAKAPESDETPAEGEAAEAAAPADTEAAEAMDELAAEEQAEETAEAAGLEDAAEAETAE